MERKIRGVVNSKFSIKIVREIACVERCYTSENNRNWSHDVKEAKTIFQVTASKRIKRQYLFILL